ncbi:hypothetical protein AMAG_11724 [Allomyces macrogynus ATCC 38327]|uniref:Uncharacterized protein n=1 Tax=Allomyces macrogynus (strain ATCC 38327) TaxID=578462 RepID=A0A0L0SVV4_ALLM3|nr:hypothetical protein AMAG_11724 [Allomyces macrogynus ATCC 38327]|eukprot:KNE66606.1 hypothetical protein AMAG_11724 [Allomyces macrogynus ATCC 38327]
MSADDADLGRVSPAHEPRAATPPADRDADANAAAATTGASAALAVPALHIDTSDACLHPPTAPESPHRTSATTTASASATPLASPARRPTFTHAPNLPPDWCSPRSRRRSATPSAYAAAAGCAVARAPGVCRFPRSPRRLLLLAHAKYNEADYAAALSVLQTLYLLVPAHIPTLLLLGCTCFSLGQLPLSIFYNQLILALNPQFAEAYSNLGTTYRALGDDFQAEHCYRAAVELRPEYWDGARNLVSILCAKGKWDEALRVYERAEVTLAKSDAAAALWPPERRRDLHYAKANIRLAMGNVDLARVELVVALRCVGLDPEALVAEFVKWTTAPGPSSPPLPTSVGAPATTTYKSLRRTITETILLPILLERDPAEEAMHNETDLGKPADPAVDAEAERARREQALVDLRLANKRDMMRMSVDAIVFPAVAAQVGRALAAWVPGFKRVFPTTLLQSLVGGVAVVVAKDVIGLRYRYLKLSAARRKRVVNYIE